MEKLIAFATGPEMPIHAGARTMFAITATEGPSIPMVFRFAPEAREHFRIHNVSVGCGSILVFPKHYCPSELESVGSLLPELLHRGMDFSIYFENVSESAQPFRCEVWGLPKAPLASWERVKQDMTGREPTVLALVRCSTCGHVLELRAGSWLPNWCPRCVEDPEGFDSETGEGDAHDVPAPH